MKWVRARYQLIIAWVVSLVVSAIPVIQNAASLAQQPVMQRLDYWPVMRAILGPDGSLIETHVFRYQNEHPLAVPSVIYWLNYRLTGGYAWSLGVIVFAIVAVTIGLLVYSLSDGQPSRWFAPALTAGVAWMLFSPRGAANLAYPMSGAAWCLANLWSVCAIILASRRRFWPALAFCALASVTYGTGLCSWFGVAAVAFAQYLAEGRRRSDLLRSVAAGVVGVGVVIYVLETIPAHSARSGGGLSLPGRISNVLTVGGAIFNNADMAVLVGTVTLVGATVAVVALLSWLWREGSTLQLAAAAVDVGEFSAAPDDATGDREDAEDVLESDLHAEELDYTDDSDDSDDADSTDDAQTDAGEPDAGEPDEVAQPALVSSSTLVAVGLAVLSVAMCCILGFGRSGGGAIGLSSRYTSITGFAVIALFAIVPPTLLKYRRDVPVMLPMVLLCSVGLLSFASAQPALDSIKAQTAPATRLAIAMKLGHTDGFPGRPDVETLRAAKHVPFNGDPIGDCNLIGTDIDLDSITRTVDGKIESVEEAENPDLSQLRGWIGEAPTWDCAVVVDSFDGRVVGAAVIGYPRPDVRKARLGPVESGFLALFPAYEDPSELIVVGVRSGEFTRMRSILAPRSADDSSPSASSEEADAP